MSDLVPREGFEPPTCGIEAHRSNPLSYRGGYHVLEAVSNYTSQNGAGGGSLTRVACLEGRNNKRYTTPAWVIIAIDWRNYSVKYAFLLDVVDDFYLGSEAI